MRRLFLLLLLLVLAFPAFAQESLNDLPLPRWASLASPEANLRTGPGKRYPIDWILKKKNLPVEITQEFEHWRRVKEPGGADGWIHKSMLTGMRHVLVQKETPIFAQPSRDSRAVAVLQKGVIADLKQCQKEWCRIEIENFSGWIQKRFVWGVYRHETLDK